MAHGRSTGFARRGSSSRRKTGWSVGPSQVPIGISATGSLLWALSSQVLVDGLTLIRIRGEFSCHLNVVTAISDGFASFAVGLCNVSENAFNAGIVSVPSPITDMAWPGWMYHSLHAELTGLETTEVGRGPLSAVRVSIDSKAMRKVRIMDVLCGVIEVGAETGTANLVFSATTRILDKLP